MKKMTTLVLAVLVALSFTSCAKQTAPDAGSATGEAMLNMLPQAVTGVFLVDVHKAATTAAVERALSDEETQTKYQEFVEKTGVDPVKDIFYIAAGFTGEIWGADQEGAVIINLKYEKETLLDLLRKEAGELQEDIYNGVTVYKGGQEDAKPGKESFGAFLDDSNIVIGNEGGVKSVIDVYQKKADSVAKNKDMGQILKGVDKSALAWGAFAIPPETVSSMIEENPMLSVLEGISGLVLAFDYKNSSVIVDLRTTGGTEENNKNLADMLNGFKAMGGMATAQEPALGELLDRLVITSGPDFVKIYLDIPEEVMDKLQEAAKSRLSETVETEK